MGECAVFALQDASKCSRVIAGGTVKRGDSRGHLIILVLVQLASLNALFLLHHIANMVSKRQKRSLDDDPLARAIAPPPNESPAEREHRMAAESEAKRVSDAIDDELNRQRIADKKNPRPVKILLLGASLPLPPSSSLQLSTGQSESGMTAIWCCTSPR